MTSGVNLIPSEFEPKGSVAKISKNLKRFGYIVIILFFIITSFSGAAVFVLGRRITSSRESNSNLKNELVALKGTVQSLVLVQDRVKKIDLVDKKKDTKDEIDILAEISANLTEGVIIRSLHLKEERAEITFQSANLPDMTRYMNSVGGMNIYKNITLISFEFTPANGYLVTLGFSKN